LDFVQTIKSEHARVTDIVEKLADTSEGAVKTRERLAGQLRTLLGEHTRKEESYLYPALQNHEEARDFLKDAQQAHDEIERLAGELDGTQKDDGNFLSRLDELRRVLQPHIQAEEKLLPGVRRAMSEDERRRLDEAFSGPMDVAQQGERGQSERGAGARVAEATGGAMREGVETVTRGARRVADEAAAQTERTGQSVLAAAEIYTDTAQLTAEDMQAIATCSTIAAGGMTEMRQAWMDWLGRTLRTSARASQDLLRCSTIEQLAEVQRTFLKESFESLLEGSAQMLRISTRVTDDARRPIEDRMSRGQRAVEERGRQQQSQAHE
jgi:phasin family protein